MSAAVGHCAESRIQTNVRLCFIYVPLHLIIIDSLFCIFFYKNMVSMHMMTATGVSSWITVIKKSMQCSTCGPKHMFGCAFGISRRLGSAGCVITCMTRRCRRRSVMGCDAWHTLESRRNWCRYGPLCNSVFEQHGWTWCDCDVFRKF